MTNGANMPFAERINELASALRSSTALIFLDQFGRRQSELSWDSLRNYLQSSVRQRSTSPLVEIRYNDERVVMEVLAGLYRSTFIAPVPEARSRERRLLIQAEKAAKRGSAYGLFSGGSTGPARMIVYQRPAVFTPSSHPSLLLQRAGWRNGQRQLLIGPLYHAASFFRLIDGILAGNCTVVPTTFSTRAFWIALEKYGVDWVQLAPAHMMMLARSARWVERLSVHPPIVLHTAAPCPDGIKQDWLDAIGASRLFEMYTSAEGFGATLCTGEEWLTHRGSVGRGVMTQVEVRQTSGDRCPPGVVGTVFLRGPRADAAPMREHKLERPRFEATSDLGYLDDDGFLYLVGRRDHIINIGGVKVNPEDVVRHLLRYGEHFSDAICFRIPDAALGERLCVWAVAENPSSISATAMRTVLAQGDPMWRLAEVRLVCAIPRTDAGKINWNQVLRGQAAPPLTSGG